MIDGYPPGPLQKRSTQFTSEVHKEKIIVQQKPDNKVNFNLSNMSAKKNLHIYAELCISEKTHLNSQLMPASGNSTQHPVSFAISNDCKKLFVYKASAVIKIFNSMKKVVLIKTAGAMGCPTVFDLKGLKNGSYIIEANRQKYKFRYSGTQRSFAAYLFHFFNR